ncbi:MAG: response regulator transcription factor [Alphaproteobacteria bacterium]|nr:response regulator transcription factor [Alphaproteobacteria bacterium]
MHRSTVLSIDDDEHIQVVIKQYLEDDGYNVINATDVASALEKVKTEALDIILLDLVLPDGEGLPLIPQFRTLTTAGIIVVSGKSESTEKIICLEMGADDYITKPFEMRELVARIKALKRRMNPAEDKPPEITKEAEKIELDQGWVLDRTQYQLYDKDGRSANLTANEFKLLEVLVLSANRVLSREHLFNLTRDGRFDSYDRAIDIQIGRIRKKMATPLQDNEADFSETIKTIRGVGYMFCGKSAAP